MLSGEYQLVYRELQDLESHPKPHVSDLKKSRLG